MLLEGDSAQVKTHLQIRAACGGLRAAAGGGGGGGCSHAGFFPFFNHPRISQQGATSNVRVHDTHRLT